MRALLALPLLVGCIGPEPWGRADIEVWGDARFERIVAQAVNEWDLALADRCGGPVLRIVDVGSGHPVREVDASTWLQTEGQLELGYFDGDEVAVRVSPLSVERAVVVHELGHAIGLHHVAVADDGRSVMHESSNMVLWHPTERDAMLAARALDCE